MTDTKAPDLIEGLTKALSRLLGPFEGDTCRLDHHGYCQEHFLESDCCVANARKILAHVNETPKPAQVSGDVSAERAALAEILLDEVDRWWAGTGSRANTMSEQVADALIAQGWRRGYTREKIGRMQDAKRAYQRGQEDMRERAANRIVMTSGPWKYLGPEAIAIRALPIKENNDDA